MTKENLVGTFVIMSLIGIIGFVMLFFSVNFGTSLAEAWLVKRGGADTNTYNVVMKSYINNFLVCGGILFAFGLLSNILAYYKWQNIKEKSK